MPLQGALPAPKKSDGRANNGGARKGAGRPQAFLTKTAKDTAVRATDEAGITPFEVMINNMAFWFGQAEKLSKKIETQIETADLTDPKQIEDLTNAVKRLVSYREFAQKCAVDAAPYRHPRLAAIEFSGFPEGPTTPIDEKMKPKEAADAYAQAIGS